MHAVEFLEQGNLTSVNLREHLNLFLGNKGETLNGSPFSSKAGLHWALHLEGVQIKNLK